ncbi:hypothetical protein [Algoriphagus sp. NG3]|uniref:hypothetical protein n=1 Tax=Algoriphagus sp. NG3 TaxID=3097546 RepID=UPI002A803507|nr:hypothetical protein [Algoriphagus sp. NG3]WPR77525.1 hypothetical protein SLW71_09215 [Algoriphagus sp. NG3]
MEHQIKMGRDALFELLSVNNLLIKRRKRRVHTTNSFHWLRKYPNLIRGYTPTSPNQLWVSDITYWRLKDRFLYTFGLIQLSNFPLPISNTRHRTSVTPHPASDDSGRSTMDC